MGTAATDDEPPAYGSPMSHANTPSQKAISDPNNEASTFDDRPAYVKNLGDAKESAGNPAMSDSAGQMGQTSQPASMVNSASNAASNAAQSVAAAVPTTSDEMKQQLANANTQISRLTAQAAESTGLRQRKTDGTADNSTGTGTSAMSMQQPPNGVPVPLVAALCLLSFLLAYLLF